MTHKAVFTKYYCTQEKFLVLLHSVTVWKLQKFSLTLFHKNFVKAMVLLKKLLSSWFYEIFFQCGKMENLHSHRAERIFRQINSLLVNKWVAFTKFLPKSVGVNFRNFHSMKQLQNSVWKWVNFPRTVW